MAERRFLIASRTIEFESFIPSANLVVYGRNSRAFSTTGESSLAEPFDRAPLETNRMRCACYWFSTQGSLGRTNGKPITVMVYLYVPGAAFMSLQMNLVFPARWH